MNKFELNPELQRDRQLAERVQALAPVVGEALGSSGSQVNARWRLAKDDPAQPFVVLNLSEWSYPWGVDRGFEPDTLEDSRQFRRQILDSLFDLRWAQLQKTMTELKAMTFDGDAS